MIGQATQRAKSRRRPCGVCGRHRRRAVRSALYGALALALLAPVTAGALPDGRVYEQVSPLQKNGNDAGATSLGGGGLGEVEYAAAEAGGEGMLYGGLGPFGTTSSGADFFSVARRGPHGWTSTASLPSGYGIDAANYRAERPESLLSSTDLARFAFTTAGSFVAADPTDGSLTSEGVWRVGAGEAVSWLSQPGAGFTPEPEPGKVFGPYSFSLTGGSPDLSTVYFSYLGTLLPADASRTPNVRPVSGVGSWGFYEWSASRGLTEAGVLPDGSLDPYGAIPAGGQDHGYQLANPDDFENQVSADGSTAFFVSPDPYSEATPLSDPPELYAREQGQSTVLISRSELTGLPAEGPAGTSIVGFSNPDSCSTTCTSYVYAAPDGSRAFFRSADSLTGDAPNDSSVKEYEFNLNPGVAKPLRYLPGLNGSILGSSQDGSQLIFQNTGTNQLELWANEHATAITPLPPPLETETNFNRLFIAPVRASADGSVFVFATDSPLPGGFNNALGYMQIYRYEVGAAKPLICVSCPPPGVAPEGDARLSNDDHALGSPKDDMTTRRMRGNRGISEDGSEVFFDTPTALVPLDINGQRDVYEWENGRAQIISSGTSPRPSVYLDNSASGRDIFFATTDTLIPSDIDGSFDVYDARVGGGFPEASQPTECLSDCQESNGRPPVFEVPYSATFSGPGNAMSRPPSVGPSKGSKQPAKKKKKKKSRPKRPKGKKQHGSSRRRAHRSTAKARGGR